MRHFLGLMAVTVVVTGCGGSSSTADAPPASDARSDDAMADSGGAGGTCQRITPWCADGFCLTTPAAPHRGNASASALAANGELYFAVGQNNTLGHISPATPMDMVILPAGSQPGFKTGVVSAMTAVSPTDIYACSPLTIVWHYDGAQWSQLPPGWLSGECDVLWAGSDTDFWSIGAGYLRRKLNGTWTPYGGTRQVYALAGRSADDVWFGGAHGYLAHWDGTQYQVLIDTSDNSDVPDVRDVAILGPNDVAFGANRVVNGTLMTSAQLGYPAAPELTWGSSNDFWIVTKSDGVTPQALWRYHGTWTQAAVPAGVALSGLAITGRSPNDVWFTSDHALLHWDGTALASCATWQPSQPTGRLVGVGASYGDLWLQDLSNGLWHSTAGSDFVAVPAGAAGVRGFDAHASGVFVASGTEAPDPRNGTMPVVQRYAGGSSWTDITCPWTPGEDALLDAVKIVGAADVWFAGNGGHVYHWDGTACAAVAHPLAVTTFRHINARSATDVWIFGDTATLHWDGAQLQRYAQTLAVIDSVATPTSLWGLATSDVLEWNGATWTSRGGGSIANARRIWATSGTDVWVYGDTLVRFDGATWTPQPLPDQAYAGVGTGVGLWGTGAPGDFAISIDGGIVRHR